MVPAHVFAHVILFNKISHMYSSRRKIARRKKSYGQRLNRRGRESFSPARTRARVRERVRYLLSRIRERVERDSSTEMDRQWDITKSYRLLFSIKV